MKDFLYFLYLFFVFYISFMIGVFTSDSLFIEYLVVNGALFLFLIPVLAHKRKSVNNIQQPPALGQKGSSLKDNHGDFFAIIIFSLLAGFFHSMFAGVSVVGQDFYFLVTPFIFMKLLFSVSEKKKENTYFYSFFAGIMGLSFVVRVFFGSQYFYLFIMASLVIVVFGLDLFWKSKKKKGLPQ